jgi:Icc-related predicted phosphoesterase
MHFGRMVRMKVTAISDLHGHYPMLDGGDLLIVAGDLTGMDQVDEYLWFRDWLQVQEYDRKILIAGNHDKAIQDWRFYPSSEWLGAYYLHDSFVMYKGLKIWGSPWTRWFEGINPDCDAYTLKTEQELEEKYALIPDDTDILITHGPAYGTLDRTVDKENAGSIALAERLIKLKVTHHIFGHIHEAYGTSIARGYLSLNVSHMDRSYEPVNKPVNFEIEVKDG